VCLEVYETVGALGANMDAKMSDPAANAEFTQSSLEFWLMIEYKNLVPAHRRPSGVYVMPSFDDMLVWYGVIFVHHGYYRKGVFKFRIELPRHYPNVRPEVFFLGPVHHPYVRANGHLDLSLPFPQWIPKQHFIIHVLQFMKKMFYKIDILVIEDPQMAPNPEALELYRDSTIRFWHAAQKCVNDCVSRELINAPANSIRFMDYEKNQPEYDKVLEKILSSEEFGKEPATQPVPAEQKPSYLSWFVGSVKSKIGNIMQNLKSPHVEGTPAESC